MRLYRTAEVASITGATLRQLDWWHESGARGHAKAIFARSPASVIDLSDEAPAGVTVLQIESVA